VVKSKAGYGKQFGILTDVVPPLADKSAIDATGAAHARAVARAPSGGGRGCV